MRKSVHSQAQKRFCAFLVKTRREAGMSQSQLAARLGRPQSFIAKVEGGERRVDVIEFLAIAKALGRDPIRLMKSIVLCIDR